MVSGIDSCCVEEDYKFRQWRLIVSRPTGLTQIFVTFKFSDVVCLVNQYCRMKLQKYGHGTKSDIRFYIFCPSVLWRQFRENCPEIDIRQSYKIGILIPVPMQYHNFV